VKAKKLRTNILEYAVGVEPEFETGDHTAIFPSDLADLIVVELDECEAGMPQSRLTDLVSIIKPHCRAVVVRIAAGLPCPRAWRDCGTSGVAVVWDGTESLSDRDLMQRLKRFGDAAAGPRTFIIGHGFRRRGWALAAWAEGFTHISGQVITDEARATGQAIRLSPADIFTPATGGA